MPISSDKPDQCLFLHIRKIIFRLAGKLFIEPVGKMAECICNYWSYVWFFLLWFRRIYFINRCMMYFIAGLMLFFLRVSGFTDLISGFSVLGCGTSFFSGFITGSSSSISISITSGGFLSTFSFFPALLQD